MFLAAFASLRDPTSKAFYDRHSQLGLSVAEAAFYDAIVQNDTAILQMGDDILKRIAVDLVYAVQQSVTIDWPLKESVRATMRSKVRRLLAKYDYPPGHEERAIELVLQQAELLRSRRSWMMERSITPWSHTLRFLAHPRV